MATGDLKELLKYVEETVAFIEDSQRKRIAFELVLDHLLKTSDGNLAADGRSPAPPIGAERPIADSAFASEQQRIDEIAQYFGIEPEQVPDIFDLSDEDPRLTLAKTKLSQSKVNGTRDIALLVTGMRTALGRHTDTEHIREAAVDYGKLDSSNFMQTLAAMTQLSLLGKSSSPRRAVRMKIRGAEEARRLVQSILIGSTPA